MIYFTSDTHFGHNNIIKYSNRPFETIEHMNEEFIKNWNYVVKATDEVYHLGDVGLGNPIELHHILERLNGKIYLIKGNHEKCVMDIPHNIDRFEWIRDYYELKYQKQMFVLMHYPIGSWRNAHHGSIHLHGHSHNSYSPKGKMMDVGVDNPICNYTPISIEKIIELMKDKQSNIVDHHA